MASYLVFCVLLATGMAVVRFFLCFYESQCEQQTTVATSQFKMSFRFVTIFLLSMAKWSVLVHVPRKCCISGPFPDAEIRHGEESDLHPGRKISQI